MNGALKKTSGDRSQKTEDKDNAEPDKVERKSDDLGHVNYGRGSFLMTVMIPFPIQLSSGPTIYAAVPT